MLWQKGDLKGATDALQAAVRRDPEGAEVHYQLGLTFRKEGKLLESVEELRRATSLKADYSEAYFGLGQTLQQLGKQQEAQAAFAEVERLHRAVAEFAQANTKYNLGLQKLADGDLPLARDAFQAALSIKPDFPEARTNLGGVLLKLGETENAVGQLRTAIDLKPDDARAYYNLGLALPKQGDTQGEHDAFERAAQLDPHLTLPQTARQ